MKKNPYLNQQLVEEIFAKYTWPAPYEVKPRYMESVIVQFPQCGFVLMDGGRAGDTVLRFMPKDTGVKQALSMIDALSVLAPFEQREGSHTPGLIKGMYIPGYSEEKTRRQLTNICITAQYHFKPTILGDFSWVQAFLEKSATP